MITRVLAGFAALLSAGVAAQEYPNRPVRFIVPFPPGGLDASRKQGPASSSRDATVRESAAAAVLVAQTSDSTSSYPNRPVRFIVPFPPGGLGASRKQSPASSSRDATVRESAAAAVLVAQTSDSTSSYPNRPVRFIVPFPPGGGNDTMARTVGNKLAAALGQQFVIDNRPGAGGIIGAEMAARSVPDGYTLFLGGVASHGIVPNLRTKLGYDPIKDFAPISLIAAAPLVLVVHPSVPATNVQELVQLAKTKPGQLVSPPTEPAAPRTWRPSFSRW